MEHTKRRRLGVATALAVTIVVGGIIYLRLSSTGVEAACTADPPGNENSWVTVEFKFELLPLGWRCYRTRGDGSKEILDLGLGVTHK